MIGVQLVCKFFRCLESFVNSDMLYRSVIHVMGISYNVFSFSLFCVCLRGSFKMLIVGTSFSFYGERGSDSVRKKGGCLFTLCLSGLFLSRCSMDNIL